MSARGMTSFLDTAVLPSFSVPSAGRVTIFTPPRLSPLSASAKLKSVAVKTWGVFSFVVTMLSAAVGAVLFLPLILILSRPLVELKPRVQRPVVPRARNSRILLMVQPVK